MSCGTVDSGGVSELIFTVGVAESVLVAPTFESVNKNKFEHYILISITKHALWYILVTSGPLSFFCQRK